MGPAAGIGLIRRVIHKSGPKDVNPFLIHRSVKKLSAAGGSHAVAFGPRASMPRLKSVAGTPGPPYVLTRRNPSTPSRLAWTICLRIYERASPTATK
jgi:hypothetical protein